MKFDDLLTGFIRLHTLHHAAEMEIHGQWMIDELGHHGYRLSPGIREFTGEAMKP